MIGVQNFFGMIALVTSMVGLLPQVYKSWRTRSAKDLSVLMLVNYFVCSIAWIAYGAYTDTIFVLLSNVLGVLSCLILMVQKYYYDRHSVV